MDCSPALKKREPTEDNRAAWPPSYTLFEIVRRWRSESRPLSDMTIVMVVLLQGGPNVYCSFDFRAPFVRSKIGAIRSQAWAPEDMVL